MHLHPEAEMWRSSSAVSHRQLAAVSPHDKRPSLDGRDQKAPAVFIPPCNRGPTLADFRIAPKADVGRGAGRCRKSATRRREQPQQNHCRRCCLFDHLVSRGEQRLWHRQAKSLSGLKIDSEFELRRLLNGHVFWRRTFKDTIYIGGHA